MERNPIVILPKYLERVEELPSDCRDAMVSAIVYYGVDGINPTFEGFPDRDRMFMLATFSGIKGFIDKSRQQREAGKAGSGESKARYGNQNATKTQP